jgi:hypothetical protein
MWTNKEYIKQKLISRYYEQCERFPIMRRDIPLSLYIARNLRQAIRNTKERAKWESGNVDR